MTQQQAESEALDWFLRHQAGRADAADPAFTQWRNSDPEHARAYARVQAVWAAPAFVAALATQPEAKRRAMRPLMQVAASVALLLLVGSGGMRLAGLPWRLPASHAATIGGQEVAQLDDGTKLVLDSGAAVDVAYTATERRMVLRDGRAFFAVGKDAGGAPRAFRVAAGRIVVRDIGTRFSVEKAGDAVRVAVEQGEVALRPDGAGPEQHLTAGQTGGYADGFLPVHAAPADITFAWLDHRLFFSQARLGDVVQDLRRYHRGWIILANPRLAALKVSGGYDTRDPASAMADLARLSGGTLIRLSDRLLILR
ncbi:FecR family protein [Novosphingobium rosa]|uniref:FecR family protein n=1 Tax=Novosphingobium rosa TaxID=76978 RepID=UPI000835E7E7|nr:FecR domain-containing protein [Novosphingobium rosa]